jgi:[ribosomal protein S18]-alanine N-acetyltransferase
MRFGTTDDIPVVIKVMESAFDPAFGEAWSADQLRGALSMPGCSLLITQTTGSADGFALMRVVLDEAELLLIAVDQTKQRHGLGKSLFQNAVDVVRGDRAKTLHVEVREDNPALEFYRSLGFVKVGERPNYYRRNDGGPTKAITLLYTIN